jgi:aspartate/glutamate racemase
MNKSLFPSIDPAELFSDYLRVTGIAHLGPEQSGEPGLVGKRLGLLNGSSWITLWSNYFGRLYLPGIHLVNAGNEAVQLNFMDAHQKGLVCPPQTNIEAFIRYARDLVELAQVDMVLITCSTMNRAYPKVATALQPYAVPVIQIDQPMMERAVYHGGKVLVVATHGPTVNNTQALLRETAVRLGRELSFSGTTVEAAWECLAAGDVLGHNRALADAIHAHLAQEPASCVILAQLSMACFLFSYPDPLVEFGIPVYTSAQCGFEKARELLMARSKSMLSGGNHE